MTTGDEISQLIRLTLDELKEDYDTAPGTLWATRRESFVQTLRSRGVDTHPVVERLLQRLDDSAEDDRKSMLASGQLDSEAHELISQYTARQDQGQAQAAAPAYDPDTWYAYLRESAWRWDGTEEAWGPFREWIVYDADQRGLAAPTKALMDELSADAAAERIAKLAQYGITIAVPAQHSAGEPTPPAYDPDAWYAYLRESAWRWDGTEEAWGPFREWIVYDADQRGLAAPTKALMDELSADAAAERIAKLAQYGVTIAVPPRHGAGEPASPEPGPPAAPAVTGADIKQVMDDLIAENPRFAQVPEERRAAVAAQALRLLRSRGT